MSENDIPLFARITAIVGAFGSGKTEIAVNYALLLAARGEKVKLADLDIVNPYFRSREVKQELEAQGIEVVVPTGGDFYADLPIIVPQIRGMIRDGRSRAILDIGGDDLGARVLSSFYDVFRDGDYALLMVLNGNRPFTKDIDGCLDMIGKIQDASRLRVTGLVANTHLMAETTVGNLARGCDLVNAVSAQTGIPVAFAAVETRFSQHIAAAQLGCPVLLIERRMLPPWQQGIPQNSFFRRRPHA